MLARSFLIESSSTLLVTRTGIKAWSSSNLGRIRLLILELLALEWRKSHTFELEYLWSQLANLDHIICVASLGWGKGCIMFWGRLDQNSGFHGNRKPLLTYIGENDVSTFSRLFLIRSFLAHAGNKGMHKNSDKFKFRPDCPWDLKNFHASSFIFDWIIIKVAGNQDRHKSSDEFDFGPLVSMAHLYVFEMRFDLGTLDSGERSLPFGLLVILAGKENVHKISDEFEFQPDRTTDYGVSCPWVSKKFPIDL